MPRLYNGWSLENCRTLPPIHHNTPCPDKKGATDLFAVTLTNIDVFS